MWEKVYKQKMSLTPKFDELKEACGSDKLHHALRLLFLHEEAYNEGLILLLSEECDDLRARIGKRELLQEGGSFSRFDPVAVNGIQCLQEAQSKDFQLLAALVVLLGLVHETRVEKRRHVVTMEQYD